MTPLTVLYKQKRVAKCNKNLAMALVKHDLLLDNEAKRSQNRITEKSKDNVYKLYGKLIINPADRTKALEAVELLFTNDNHKMDLQAFRKLKHKLKKWSQNNRNSAPERKFYETILNLIQNEKSTIIKSSDVLNKFNALELVKRISDKSRALIAILQLHNLRASLNIDQSSQLKICLVSIVFKIPSLNEHQLSAEEQERLVVGYFGQYFPQFPIVFSALHKDEIDHHVHLAIDARNKNTGEYDFVQAQYELIKKLANSIADYEDLYSDLGKSKKQKTKQIANVGRLLQTHFYRYLNTQQQKHVFAKKEYETPELKKLERKKIAIDTNKRIADREYNTANYLTKEKNKLSNELAILCNEHSKVLEETTKIKHKQTQRELQIKTMHSDIYRLRVENETLKAKIEDTRSTLNEYEDKLKGLIHSTLVSAISYANNPSESHLKLIEKAVEKMFVIHPEVAREVRNAAIDIQPSEEQKRDIKHFDTYSGIPDTGLKPK
ncbi:hypothetical protein [Glaciecola sp. SC05]|uniref:hypothetical protein n=1 Tax=Glaciecola sp. SC05 TaxID=1987355 RepID=UPI0035270DEE